MLQHALYLVVYLLRGIFSVKYSGLVDWSLPCPGVVGLLGLPVLRGGCGWNEYRFTLSGEKINSSSRA